jgi:hypothetical protein
MKIRASLASLILLGAIGMAAQASRFEFKGDALGMLLSTFEGRHNLGCEAGNGKPAAGRLGLVQCELVTTIANHPADTAIYRFLDHNLFLIDVTFPHEAFKDVLRAVGEKYGRPIQESTETLQNSFGARYVGRLILWRRGTDAITLREYAGGLTTSEMNIVDNKLLRAAQSRFPKDKPDF